MGTDLSEWVPHPAGEQAEVEQWSAVAGTFAGRVHIEWDPTAPVTPLAASSFLSTLKDLSSRNERITAS